MWSYCEAQGSPGGKPRYPRKALDLLHATAAAPDGFAAVTEIAAAAECGCWPGLAGWLAGEKLGWEN